MTTSYLLLDGERERGSVSEDNLEKQIEEQLLKNPQKQIDDYQNFITMVMKTVSKNAESNRINLERLDLTRINLIETGAHLPGSNLKETGAHLPESNLKEASLKEIDFLEGVYLSGVDLSGMNLEEANLTGANLWKANLEGVNLEGANLKGINLKGVQLNQFDLNNPDIIKMLSEANLEEADWSGVTDEQKEKLLSAK